MNIRTTGLALAVVCAALLPIAASAGPVSEGGSANGSESGSESGSKNGSAKAPQYVSGNVLGNDKTAGRRGILAETDAAPAAAAVPARDRTSERCGPELTSPDGVEAQTCVLAEGPDTWARTYYRNATGGELSSVLSLMGPGGRTVQTHCVVEAGDEPAACETPREKARGEVGEYAAVAEFAGSGDLEDPGEGPLLLRSGSNSPAATGS
ncbi:hypothetical protein [Streptomyces formicae]|uniref:Secreted protein n=1 Tax=Streptomyces formicae TaxID=1616117 RepID=A0ABY3WU40_9ACTN|nr:hypothetical protein [Streptomyces formicae]UNM16169.1 hypothetical protein J4032_36135 [Streptomyces formicae]